MAKISVTVQDILDLLPIVQNNRGWRLRYRGTPDVDLTGVIGPNLLRSAEDECPLCALVNEILGYEPKKYYGAAWSAWQDLLDHDDTFKYDDDEINQVVRAADDFLAEPYRDLREQLFQAVGFNHGNL